MTALLVALGAAVGAPARFLLDRAVGRPPLGTLLVNVLGSFALGCLARAGSDVRALAGVGFCGAFTTFSAYAVEAARSPTARGVAYAVGAVGLCLGAAALGLVVA